jgi:hypothetical protein
VEKVLIQIPGYHDPGCLGIVTRLGTGPKL